MRSIVNWLVFLVCAALPLYVIRFKIFGIPSTFLEILILILFLTWFLERGMKMKKWFKLFDIDDFSIPVVFLLMIAAISVVLSFDKNGGLGIFRAYFLEPVLLFLVVLERVRHGDGKYAFAGLALASVWLSILAVFQKVGLVTLPDYAKSELAQGRVVGVYNSANSLALFIGPVFALVLGGVFSNLNSKNFILLFFFSLVLFLQAVVIILTKSQAAIFAAGFVSVFVILSKILSAKSTIKFFRLGLLLMFFLIISLPVLAFIGINFGVLFSDQSFQNRHFVWQGTLAMFLDRPLTGSGLDGFKELYSANYLIPAYNELLQYPHNLFLTFWSELGLVGVFVFFWLFLKFARKSSTNKFLGLGLMSAIIYFLIHGIVDVPYFKNDLSAQFFILLAFLEFKDENII